MGYMSHHVIVVIGFNYDSSNDSLAVDIRKAHEKAVKIFPVVSEIMDSGVNSYRSFMIPPDGSKEGWDKSKQGNIKRHEYIQWLNAHGEDLCCSWAEVNVGDEDKGDKITRGCYLNYHDDDDKYVIHDQNKETKDD